MNLLDDMIDGDHYNPNITATLSARKSNAQPWRFFCGSRKPDEEFM